MNFDFDKSKATVEIIRREDLEEIVPVTEQEKQQIESSLSIITRPQNIFTGSVWQALEW